MDKIYSLIQKTPMGQKIAALGMLIALLIGGHWYLVYGGQKEEKQKLERQREKLQDELYEKERIAKNFNKFKMKVARLELELKEREKNLPSDANMDQLLKTLNELSEQSDIQISKFTPKQQVKKGFYAEIPVQMELEGSYHEIVSFFDNVSKEDRIINISNITLKNPEMRNNKVMLEAKCLARTFRSIPPHEREKGDQAKGKKRKRRKK